MTCNLEKRRFFSVPFWDCWQLWHLNLYMVGNELIKKFLPKLKVCIFWLSSSINFLQFRTAPNCSMRHQHPNCWSRKFDRSEGMTWLRNNYILEIWRLFQIFWFLLLIIHSRRCSESNFWSQIQFVQKFHQMFCQKPKVFQKFLMLVVVQGENDNLSPAQVLFS